MDLLQLEATTEQGFMKALACYEETLMGQKMSLFRQTSVFDFFFKISSWTCASPPGLSDIGEGHPSDRPTVQVEVPPPSFVLFVRFHIPPPVSMNVSSKHIVWNCPPHFDIVFKGKSVSTYVASHGPTTT